MAFLEKHVNNEHTNLNNINVNNSKFPKNKFANTSTTKLGDNQLPVCPYAKHVAFVR